MDILMQPKFEHVVRKLTKVGVAAGLDEDGKMRLAELLRQRGLDGSDALVADFERQPQQSTITKFALECMDTLVDTEDSELHQEHVDEAKMLEMAEHMKAFSGAMVCANSAQYPGCMPVMFSNRDASSTNGC